MEDKLDNAPETVSLDDLLSFASEKISLAYFYMGFSLNCSDRQDCTRYRLPITVHIDDFKEFSGDQLNNAKAHYRNWIIGTSLGDAIQSHAIFLDEIYILCLLVDEEIKKEFSQNKTGLFNSFEKKGAAGKAQHLREAYKFLGETHSAYLHGLTKTRNCLVHSDGLVDKRHFTEGDALIVRWLGLDRSVTDEDGNPITFNELQPGHHEIRASMKLVNRQRSFEEGQRISFDPQDLEEIFWTFLNWAKHTVDGFARYAHGAGVPIHDK